MSTNVPDGEKSVSAVPNCPAVYLATGFGAQTLRWVHKESNAEKYRDRMVVDCLVDSVQA
jgi:hypothetical protein